jgi:hypothetical protein
MSRECPLLAESGRLVHSMGLAVLGCCLRPKADIRIIVPGCNPWLVGGRQVP